MDNPFIHLFTISIGPNTINDVKHGVDTKVAHTCSILLKQYNWYQYCPYMTDNFVQCGIFDNKIDHVWGLKLLNNGYWQDHNLLWDLTWICRKWWWFNMLHSFAVVYKIWQIIFFFIYISWMLTSFMPYVHFCIVSLMKLFMWLCLVAHISCCKPILFLHQKNQPPNDRNSFQAQKYLHTFVQSLSSPACPQKMERECILSIIFSTIIILTHY